VIHYCSAVSDTILFPFRKEIGTDEQACQSSDWASHKHECRALQRWARDAPSADVSVPSDAVRCIARMLWRKQKKGVDHVWVSEHGIHISDGVFFFF
jgi:hypothetical protein